MSPEPPIDDRGQPAGVASDDERIADERPRPTPLWALLSRWLLATEAWLRSHGGRRLQNSIRGFWAIVAVGGLVLLFGPVINAPLTLDDITTSAEDATDSWIARQFSVDYTITRADDGTLRAQVSERIDAFFPDEVDEQGIERVLAVEYQGHSLDPRDITATFDGEPIDVERSATPDRLDLSINTGARLSGDHEFTLDYTLRDLAYQTTDDATGQPIDLLEWDVFGPSWPHAFSGLEVRVTLPDDVDERLVRQPRGSLAWLLIGAGDWLEPVESPVPGTQTYEFSNDQNIPPNAQARFSMPFQAGTFAMPAPSAWFWVQTFGPLAPSAFLAVTLLLAFAARAVAWSDARGRPWFTAQYDPPRGVSPAMAAQIVRNARAGELASALAAVSRDAAPAATGRRRWGRRRRTVVSPPPRASRDQLITVGQVALRTGRVGDRARALGRQLATRERRQQLALGLRRIPYGFVRDLFIAAPLALTLVQWGLVRQLSYQAPLAVVWWPAAFVLVSSAIALVIVVLAVSARPLTDEGALIKQHLLGIGVFADRTRLLERGPITDRLLPYAVLLAPPRRAGSRVAELVTTELGGTAPLRGWRTRGFVTWPRLLLRTLSVLVIAGAITMITLMPNPYARGYDYATHFGDVPGTLYTTFDSIDVTAELTRTDSGAARLAVTEQLAVTIEEGSSRVPQIAQQWPDTLDGQSLGLVVERVLVDGAEVPFVTEQDGDTLLMRTTMADVLTGDHDAQIDYVLESAAVAADSPSGVVDRVRWAALLESWEYFSSWSDEPTDPQRIEVRIDDELAAAATEAGWITQDTDTADDAGDWAETVIPFGTLDEVLPAGTEELDDAETTTESTRSSGGIETHLLELRRDEYDAYPFDLRVSDTGVRFDFPAGTFSGPDEGALSAQRLADATPLASSLVLGVGAFVIGLSGLLARAFRRRLMTEPGMARDLVRWLAPCAALASLIVFFWASGDMPADDSAFGYFALAAVAALVGGVAGVVATRRAQRSGKAA